MIIGYSVLYVNDRNIKDTFWTKRVVYSTWEKALEIATKMAEEIKSNDDEILYVSLFRSDSRKTCENTGNVMVYRFIYKTYGNESGNIYIVPVYNE